MLDIKQTTIYLKIHYYFFTSGLVLMLLTFEFLGFLSTDLLSTLNAGKYSLLYTNWFTSVLEVSSIKVIGLYLYTSFSLFLLLAGVVLLIAMIGAISLTLELNKPSKQQLLYKQVNVNPKDFIFYIK